MTLVSPRSFCASVPNLSPTCSLFSLWFATRWVRPQGTGEHTRVLHTSLVRIGSGEVSPM